MPVVTARQRKAAERVLEPLVEAPNVDLAELTKRELRDVAELRGLSTSGNKAELIARLEA